MFVVRTKTGWQWGWYNKKLKVFPAASKKEAFQEAHEHELKIEKFMIENIAKLALRHGEDFFGRAFSA